MMVSFVLVKLAAACQWTLQYLVHRTYQATTLQLLRCPVYRHPADQKFSLDDTAMRNPDNIEAGTAVIEPALRERIEFLRLDAQHLGGDDELRAGFLPSDKVIESGHPTPFFLYGRQ